MTYNIRHGVGLDEVLDLSRAGNIIKAQNPDLCGLQEIDNKCERCENIDQSATLQSFNSSIGTFAEFMPYQGGAYGMDTLVKKPLISTKKITLPPALYAPRSTIVHEVEVGAQCTITFANVHFDWVSGEEVEINRLKQAKALVK